MSQLDMKTILLVEDEQIIAMSQAKVIKNFGYNVITANSGDEAVQIAVGNESVNLILMDINLGKGINGTEAADQILSKKNIPIIFLTSHSEQKIVQKVRGITSYGYVIKNSGDFVLRASIELAFQLYETNEKLRASENKFSKVFHSNSALMALTHYDDGIIVDVNSSFLNTLGYSRDEVIGKTSKDLNVFVDVVKRNNYNEKLKSSENVFDIESTLRTKSGSLLSGLFSADTIYIGKDRYLLTVMIDITDRKRNEAEIKLKNEELEATNEELNAAMEEIEASNEELLTTNHEMQLTQELLQDSEQQLSMITNNIPALISYISASDLRYLFVNQVFAEKIGMTPIQIIGKQIKDILGEESYSRALPYIERVLAGERVQYENIIPIHNEARWFSINYLPEFDAQGKVKNIIVLSFDINERKLAEEELNIFKDLVENSTDAIGMSTPEGKHYYQNEAFDRLFGNIGDNPPDTVYADKLIGKHIFDTIKQGGIWQGEVKMYKKDRSILDIFQRAYAIKNQIGQITGLVGLNTDISDQKRNEEILREKESKFRSVVEKSHVGIAIVNDASKYIYANEEFCKMAGYSEEEMLGKDFSFLLTDESRKLAIDRYMRRQRGEDVPSRYEFSFIQKSGSKRIGEVRSAVYMDSMQKMNSLIQTIDITERKMIEDELRKSEEKYRFLTNNMNDIIWTMDMNFITTYVSPSVESVLGFTVEERMEHSVTEQITPESINKVKDVMMKEIKLEQEGQGDSKKIFNYELDFYHKNGSLRIMEIVANKIRDKQGAWVGVLGVSRDITDRKKAESRIEETIKKLQIKDEQFDFITSNMMDMIAFARKDGTYKYVSPSCKTILGYSMDDMELVSGFTIIHPDDLQRITKMYNDAFVQKKTQLRYETLLRHKEGHYLPFEVFLKIIYDKDREMSGFLLTSRDISERKQAEDTLRKSEEKYRFLTNNMNDVIWTIDMNFRTTYVSPSIKTVLGFTPEERMEHSVTEQITPESINKIQEVMMKEISLEQQGLADAKKIFNFELDFYHKNGSIRVMEIVANIIRDNQGVWSGIIGVSRDITERKQSEDALRNLQKLESLGILAGGIAHDFNNLLGGIFGYIDLASSASTEKEVIGYLNESLSTINRARALTNQLLTFSKGGAPIRKAEDLLPIIRETVQFSLSGSNISHTIDAEKDLWPCFIDKNQISQVIDNIIINAQQAMPMGGTIEVYAKNIPLGDKEHSILQNEKYVKVSIKDFGIGIPKEILPYIFDPFFTTKSKGHGLGLATSFSIVNRHECLLDIESIPGKGTTFHIYLPASTEIILNEKNKSETRHKGSGTIIVMDDEEFIRNTLEKMLNSQGYKCILMKDGKEVLDFMHAEYNVDRLIAGLILDLTIPGGMGGREIVSKIREIDTKVPILVISGYADDPVIADPTSFGFTASIGKPFTMTELSAVLEKHLNNL